MPIFAADIPLSIYIHLPWCVQKCPYCDFNSHKLLGELPEAQYIQVLLKELEEHLPLIDNKSVCSLFFGGGTPSLFSAQGIASIISHIKNHLSYHANMEITLEANPGTIDQARFYGYREAGVNRLSIGVQSFANDKLLALGRIHDRNHALAAIDLAKEAGFDNINLDIMYALPQQSLTEALADIKEALAHQPTHFSWYQLTLEPNTLFYKEPPKLPSEDEAWEIQIQGQDLIKQLGYQQYEVSAYAKHSFECIHNCNYWEFGDYIGLGAGAHSKITSADGVKRAAQIKHPREYLVDKRSKLTWQTLTQQDLIFEFMLNALRLTAGCTYDLFVQRTGIAVQTIQSRLDKAKKLKLLADHPTHILPSTLGKKFLNDLIGLFLS